MLGLKLQYLASWCEEPTHHKGPWCWKDWRQEARGRQDEMVGWHHWLDGHEFEQAPEDGAGQGGLVCCSHRGHKESDTTERLNSNNTFKQTLETITTVQCRGVFPTVALDSSQRWQHPGERMLNQLPELNAGEWTVFDSGNTGRKHLSRENGENTVFSLLMRMWRQCEHSLKWKCEMGSEAETSLPDLVFLVQEPRTMGAEWRWTSCAVAWGVSPSRKFHVFSD